MLEPDKKALTQVKMYARLWRGMGLKYWWNMTPSELFFSNQARCIISEMMMF